MQSIVSLMGVALELYYKESPTYCLIPPHEFSTAPMRVGVSDSKVGWTEKRIVCGIADMLNTSVLEQS